MADRLDMTKLEMQKKAFEDRERQLNDMLKVAAHQIRTAAEGDGRELAKVAAVTLNDVVQKRRVETALYKQMVDVDSSHSFNNKHGDDFFVQFPGFEPDVEQLFGSFKVELTNWAIKVPLAEYPDATYEAYGAIPRTVRRTGKFAYFPVVKIATPLITWRKEDLLEFGTEWLKNQIEQNIEFAIGRKIDEMVLKYFEKAFAIAAANGWTTTATSANTIAQKTDWNTVRDLLIDQRLKPAKLVCSFKRIGNIYLYSGNEFGTEAGEVFKRGGMWAESVMGIPTVVHFDSPIVTAGNDAIYAIADSKYIGKFYELSPLSIYTKSIIEPEREELLVWAKQYVAFGLANVRGVTRIDFV